MQRILFVLFVLCTLFSCHSSRKINSKRADAFRYDVQKKVVVGNGAVVSAHPLASQAGLDMLKRGGNAIDAAIATQFALAVVYPQAGNIGGGGFMVARLADGNLVSIDYREKAPGRASRDMYIDSTGKARTDLSQRGHLSGGVPGTVAGLFESARYAKLPMSVLIQPAIDLAEKGFVIRKREADNLNELQDRLQRYNTMRPVFQRERPWNEGDTLIQTDLANTLKRIQASGAAGFYEGETATLIVEEMKRGGGLISYEDLKNYTAKPRQPHSFSYKDYKIVSMPMPSSGGVLINQMMKMIENRNIAAMGFQSPQAVQLMVEVERRAFADRAEHMGDADFYKVPKKGLTDSMYLLSRMNDYDATKAGNSTLVKPGQAMMYESEQTTHLSVIDKEGNAVAVTTTLNNSYGSLTVIGGAGFFLNDEMDDFSIKPGVPNMYGAVGGDANAIAPGKRMLSAMTPTIVLKNNLPYLVLGTPGGTTIPTSVFQTLVNILEFNLSTDDAVNKPKFHHQWLPDQVDLERGFSTSTAESLKQMGYIIKERRSIGRTEVIKVLPNGKFEAVADGRADDDARGF